MDTKHLIQTRGYGSSTQYLPKVFVERDVNVLGDLSAPDAERPLYLQESMDARALHAAMYETGSREANVEILLQFHDSVLLRLKGKRGRRSVEEANAAETWSASRENLAKKESAARGVVEQLLQQACPAEQQVVSKRLRYKSSQQAPAEDMSATRNPIESIDFVTVQVQYKCSLGDLLRTRRYAIGCSVQKTLVWVRI